MLREPQPIILVEHASRVARALDAIEAASLGVWYEADWRIARDVASACPAVAVYASHGHLRLVQEG
jgi:hypothetical protein